MRGCALTVACLVVFGSVAIVRAQDAELITLAQRVPVSSLDRAFPAVPFARWLAQQGAVGAAAIRWEVNDCGEGGDGRAAPACVEAGFDLASGSTAHASLLVESRDRARVKPAIYAIFAATGDVVTRFKTLREWVEYVRLHRR